MNYLKTVVLLLISSFGWSCLGIAGSNPIAWSLNQSFPSVVSSGINYSVTYTFTNQLPIPLVNPLAIEKTSSSASEFSFTDQCSGIRLAPKQQCTVKINLNPIVVGEKFVQLSIAGYDRNVVVLPLLITSASPVSSAGVIGVVTQALPNTMTLGTSANYSFTFTNYGDVDAVGLSTTITQTSGTPTTTALCSGVLSKNGGVCVVEGSFRPNVANPASQSVRATLTFSGVSGSPAVESTTTTLNTPNALIIGSIVVPNSLPPLMVPGQNYSVAFLFSNVSSGTVTLTDSGTVTCTASDSSNCSAAFTAPVSQCTNGSLGVGQNCGLTTTFSPPGGSNVTYTLTASLGYIGLGTPASVATAGTEVSALPLTRTFKMVNNCGFTLSYSLNGAALPASAPTTPCPLGSTLFGGQCWWTNHVGTSNVLIAGGNDYVTIPANSYNGIQWSGNISASTGCAQPGGGSCTQVTCDNNGGSTSCTPSKGFSQPATQAEITMLTNSSDSYDVEVINGFHIPISMQPYYVIDTIPAPQNAGFSCGTPGNSFAGGGTSNGFGSCDWGNVSVPNPQAYYYHVGGGSGANCSINACSTAGEVCGLSQNQLTGAISTPVCGTFLGYWTPNELCTQPSNLPASIVLGLQCNTPTGYNLTPADPFNNTYTSLMACPVATGYSGPTYNSCYTSSYPQGSDVSQCCGCVNWWDPAQTSGVTILANSSATTCPSGQTNPLWTGQIQRGVQWMKQACPSVYVYPFDDATSKFTCTNNTQSGTNSTSYLVTFCPGNSGLPAGATDGRG